MNFKDKFFAGRAAFAATVTRQASASKKQKVERKRILWPTTMVCAVECLKDASKSDFDASLPIIGTGHFILWAWFLAVYEALQAAAPQRIFLSN